MFVYVQKELIPLMLCRPDRRESRRRRNTHSAEWRRFFRKNYGLVRQLICLRYRQLPNTLWLSVKWRDPLGNLKSKEFVGKAASILDQIKRYDFNEQAGTRQTNSLIAFSYHLQDLYKSSRVRTWNELVKRMRHMPNDISIKDTASSCNIRPYDGENIRPP